MQPKDVQYAIEPQRNIGTTENTRHILCSDEEAEIFAVYRLTGIPGDAEWVEDFWTRVEAEEFIGRISRQQNAPNSGLTR